MPTPTIILPTEEEAQQYLQNLSKTEDSLSIWEFSSEEERTLKQNKNIIKHADTLLIDRIKSQDWSLRLTDVISAKDSAFKQNRLIEGKNDGWPQLIPSVINIQIINN